MVQFGVQRAWQSRSSPFCERSCSSRKDVSLAPVTTHHLRRMNNLISIGFKESCRREGETKSHPPGFLLGRLYMCECSFAREQGHEDVLCVSETRFRRSRADLFDAKVWQPELRKETDLGIVRPTVRRRKDLVHIIIPTVVMALLAHKTLRQR